MTKLLAGLFLLVIVTVGVAALALPRMYAQQFAQTMTPPATAWTTSKTCESCHPDHYASWHRTFHRTMTQEATPASVRGQFDGSIHRYWGIGVRPVRHGDRYFFEYLNDDNEVTVTLPVLRTVGSRRYQQYLVQTPNDGATYFRVHLLWHMEDQRWMHINGVFLRPDEQGFDDRVAVWNHNCIFCHNTGPVPNVQNMEELRQRELAGQPVNSALDARYDSSVAELGIACEACHGPGDVHAKANRNPLRRFALHLGGAPDPTITHPRKVSQQRSVDICGQCHGQRTPLSRDALMTWIDTGPSFRAGELLNDHVRPVYRDIDVPQGISPDIFKLRFWEDDTARLTAYEYQGLNQSACFDGGEITCISCHTLHSGDVHGNISTENRGNTPCLACHEELADDLTAHTGHAPDSAGSVCYECHMPKMVFGITDIHRSHRIEIPRPRINYADNRPNACTHCHVEATIDWAQTQTDTLWNDHVAVDEDSIDPTAVSHLLESLHAGDPVQRAVAARMAGRADAPYPAAARAWLIPHLLRAMADNYPSTRNLARKSLLSLDDQLTDAGIGIGTGMRVTIEQFDFIGDATHRQRLLATLQQQWLAADKSQFTRPGQASLINADWTTAEPETSQLIQRGHSHIKQIAIGE